VTYRQPHSHVAITTAAPTHCVGQQKNNTNDSVLLRYCMLSLKCNHEISPLTEMNLFTNEGVATFSQLPSINEAISRRRHSLFGHVRRTDQAAPANQSLTPLSYAMTGLRQFGTWRRQPGLPRKRWVEQVTRSAGLLPSEALRVATDQSAWRALRPVDGQA